MIIRSRMRVIADAGLQMQADAESQSYSNRQNYSDR